MKKCKWSDLVESPGAVLDAARRASVIVTLYGSDRFRVVAVQREPAGVEVVSVEELGRKRRELLFDLKAGLSFAVSRWGCVEAVVEGIAPPSSAP